ncbi:hypothetical protein [Lysobacter arvi]|uniref:Lipoprotein n=1 Tax=Lysobacter arvi TaxID=3038776 RepID=A0ABU1CH70_9GAMM|nr:hypothetical protein [Lysobacter arvi]MDR0184303.1 hypothetical protein [Lysobacter arvi]
MRKLLMAVTVSVLFAGCSKPQPPEKERPVEPQATQLRDAIDAPLEKARSVDQQMQDAADAQRAAIDAQEQAAGG